MKRKGGKGISGTTILALAFLIGLSLLLYPSISNYWNSKHQTQAIINYAEAVSRISDEEYDRLWQQAVDYNQLLGKEGQAYSLSDEQQTTYQSLLNLSDNGIMGYIDIPTINVSLPIYHGTADSVLQIGVGHLEWSSLPVGGEGSHCVLSGHRGLPSSKLFTHLDKVLEGDVFMIRVLNEILTYEVDQILIVEPNDVTSLGIVEGKDYCTLITCTPYGINTHRLLVRGHRVATEENVGTIRVTADAIQVEPLLVAPLVAIINLLLLLLALLPKYSKHKRDAKTPILIKVDDDDLFE